MKRNLIIGVGCILVSIFLNIFQLISDSKNIEYHEEIITNNFDSYNLKNNDYMGYIEIPKLNIKRLIKEDIKLIDENFVGFIKESNGLDSNIGTTILAGHNNNLVFKRLKDIEVNDIIKIKTNIHEYEYNVIDTKVIDKDNYQYYTNDGYRKLILITCDKILGKRLIIISKIKSVK